MPRPEKISALHLLGNPTAHAEPFRHPNPSEVRVPVDSTVREAQGNPLLTTENARRLHVGKDWVWDHSSRKSHISQSSEWATTDQARCA
jgi:hypothetical protein